MYGVAVMYDDSSLARNSAAYATSRASAKRPNGRWTSRRAALAGSEANRSRNNGVSTGPGQRALTRTPWRANSTPISRDIARTPPLDAVYEICHTAAPIVATNDAVLITDPPPVSSRWGMPCLQHR